jgi:hypothetical protein
MAVRTTVDIPEPLHEALRYRAQITGVSIRSLVVQAIENTYRDGKPRSRVTGALIDSKGERGPAFPVDENPHDFVFS